MHRAKEECFLSDIHPLVVVIVVLLVLVVVLVVVVVVVVLKAVLVFLRRTNVQSA